MKESLKFNCDGGFEKFDQTKEYFAGYSFDTLIAQGIVDFAFNQVKTDQDTALNHRILHASAKGFLTIGEIKRYSQLRNIEIGSYILDSKGRLMAKYI